MQAQILKKIVLGASVAVLAMTLTACDGQSKAAKKVDNLLTTSTGVNWERVKDHTRVKNYSVFYNPVEGKYYAFDVRKYVDGMTYEQYIAAAGTVYSGMTKSVDVWEEWDVIRSYTETGSYCPISEFCTRRTDFYGNDYYEWTEEDYGWVTKRETIYTDRASGLVFEVGDTSSKDLEAISAGIEAAGVSALSEMMVANYGLSEERAQEIASLAQTWQSLEQSRAMTKRDLVEFQTQVFGTDLNSITEAARKSAEGSSKDFDALVKKAAALNNISPEQAKKIVNSFVD